MGQLPDPQLPARPLHPDRLHGPAAAGPRHARVRTRARQGLRREPQGGNTLHQHPSRGHLSGPLGAIAAAATARGAAPGRGQDADGDLALPPERGPGADLPARARLLQPGELALDDDQRRRPGELLEGASGPFLRRWRLGELPPPLRPRRGKGRHRRDRARLRHVGSAHAQPDEGLDAVHGLGEVAMAKRTAKKPARRAAAGRPVRAAKTAPNGHDTQHAVEQFLYRQAELLDEKRWQDYIDLFAEDGMYWMPPEPSHATWDGMPAIFAEDKNLMTVRMKRVLHPDAWSQRPLWGTNHVVGNVVVERESPNGDVVARSRFHMMELRRDDVRHFAGLYIHHLKKTKDGYRIKLQRVDMTNAQAAYDYVLQVWV